MLFKVLVVLQADVFDQPVNRLRELILKPLVQGLRRIKDLHPLNWLEDTLRGQGSYLSDCRSAQPLIL
jgi:hypothetical protein